MAKAFGRTLKTKNQLIRRVASGVGANAYGQLITVAVQILTMPIFLTYWDIERFGIWLMLSAFPAYLSLLDLGVLTVSANEMTIAAARGERARVNQIFSCALTIFLLLSSAVLLLLCVTAAGVIFIQPANIDTWTAGLVLLLCMQLTLAQGVPDAALRSHQKYAASVYFINSARMTEWGGSIIGLACVGSFTATAIGAFFGRAIVLWISFLYARKFSTVEWNIGRPSLEEIKHTLKLSLAYLLFPISNALSFQGMTLIVGYVLGPSATAIFNAYRTLARVTVQLTGIFSHALAPEFSRLYGEGGWSKLKEIYKRSATLSFFPSTLMVLSLYFAAEWILQRWTKGVIPYDFHLLLVFLIYSWISSAWHVPRILLISVSNFSALAGALLGISVASVGLALVFAKIWETEGVALVMLSSEAATAILAYSMVNRLSKRNDKERF